MRALIDDNIAALQQGGRLLMSIDDDLYQLRAGSVFKGSIGAHVRHNLEHFRLFFAGLRTGRIDYEERQRDSLTEVDREAALSEILDLCKRLWELSGEDRPLRLMSRNIRGTDCLWVPTSVARELDFLLSHTIHHYALIAVMCRLENVPLEADFGMAPSTLRYLEGLKTPCAR